MPRWFAHTLVLSFVLLNGLSEAMTNPYQVPADELLNKGVIGRGMVRIGNDNGVVRMQVTVSPQGAVESVNHLDGPKYARDQAASAEKRLHFPPFIHNGKAVHATFRDSVSIYPKERWGDRKAFPVIRDWKTVSLTMVRREWCDEPRCASYTIQISGEGAVLFTRTKWVSSHPVNFTAQAKREEVSRLVDEFRKADFFSMLDDYAYPVTDATGVVLTIQCNGETKTTHEWAGLAAGAPTVLLHLERSIDQVGIQKGWLNSRQEPQ